MMSQVWADETERETYYKGSLWAMYALHFLLAFDFFIIAPTLYLVRPSLVANSREVVLNPTPRVCFIHMHSVALRPVPRERIPFR
jgi:hypothetical protein